MFVWNCRLIDNYRNSAGGLQFETMNVHFSAAGGHYTLVQREDILYGVNFDRFEP